MNTDKIYAEAIANEYAPKETSKVKALKRLDKKAKNPANIFAYIFGIAMSLVLGVGMCLSMQVLGDGSTVSFVLGIIIGLVGIVGVSVNYPIYKKLASFGAYLINSVLDIVLLPHKRFCAVRQCGKWRYSCQLVIVGSPFRHICPRFVLGGTVEMCLSLKQLS